MSDGNVGFGATLSVGDGSSPPVFTDIAEVASIEPATKEVADVEFTHLSSPDDTKEYKPGIIEPGEYTLECRYIPTNATHNDDSGGLLGLLVNRTTREFKCTYPDGSDDQFTGYVKSHGPSALEPESPFNLSVTIKVTGLSTLTQSA